MTEIEQMTRVELIDELMRRGDFAGVIIWRTDEPPFGPGDYPACIGSRGCDPESTLAQALDHYQRHRWWTRRLNLTRDIIVCCAAVLGWAGLINLTLWLLRGAE